MNVPFYLHSLGDEEIQRVTEVLSSPFLTTGPVTAEFETAFAAYLGVQHAIGVTSCTAGLFLSLKALGIGPGDEVITTPMSFIATANTILHTGAKPVFVDVEPDTGNLDVSLIEPVLTPRTKAIMPVHLYGQMVDMKRLKALAAAHRLSIIEDCAHSVESSRDGVRPGHLGTVACYSFYATKNLTCGEGGAITTNDPALAELLKKYRLHGMSKNAADRYFSSRYQHYDMEFLGYKCNLDSIHAALLISQLKSLNARLTRREQICQRYEQAFRAIPSVRFPVVRPDSVSARHLFTIWVAPDRRDAIMWELQKRGVGVAVNFRAIHLMRYYRDTFGYAPGMFPNAERIGDSTITLPLYPRLTDDQVDYVIETLRQTVA